MERQSALAILFADVCGSTRLYETLGDARARRMIARCIELMSDAAASHGGSLVKVIGDEVMCTFPSADQAAAAAIDMQEQVSGAVLTGGGGNMAIHVGFHFGPVVTEDKDVFGDAVNLASRMVNQAKRDQILTTGATAERLSPKWRDMARQVDRAAVRGKSEEIDVFELVWEEAEVTRVAGKAWVAEAAAPQHLVVSCGARQIELDDRHPSMTVGRGEQNELVIKDELVSRLHARIDYRNHRFTLTDQSTNGSYVVDASGNPRLVRHDSLPLSGAGMLCFGHKPGPGEAGLVRYRVTAG